MKWESLFYKGVFTHEVTPVEPLLQKLTQTNYGSCPNIIGKLLLYAEATQVKDNDYIIKSIDMAA